VFENFLLALGALIAVGSVIAVYRKLPDDACSN